MAWTDWLSIATLCALGAISPGPSLVVVARSALGGRTRGLAAALAHSLGVGIYAAATVTGLAVLVASSAPLHQALRWAGAAFLLLIGLQALAAPSKVSASIDTGVRAENRASAAQGARDGFLVAFLNPKLALFFLALFSQFVRPQASGEEKLIMVGTAWAIDALWYSLVALGLSHGPVIAALRVRGALVERLFGLILIAVAVRVAL